MDMYLLVRVLFSIILGLGISRLLTGVARIVQHPERFRVYWVHLSILRGGDQDQGRAISRGLRDFCHSI
ncbi:MAG: hypothetical protein WCA00_06155 [Candidatus Acidiferrales bacterium]